MKNKNKKNFYVLNEDLIPEIIKYKKTCKYHADTGKYIKGSGLMSSELGKMVFLIADGISKKSSFNGYT